MAGWYNAVKDDLAAVVDAVEYFENEYEAALKETSLKGNLERNARDLPGNVSYRFGQLQEIEAILEHLNIELKKMQRAHYRKYLEHYNRALSSRDAEKYSEGEQDVIDMSHLINEFALVRNKWLGLMKGMEFKHFQIGNISKLRTAGMEDISLD
jgi:hypothetical protein